VATIEGVGDSDLRRPRADGVRDEQQLLDAMMVVRSQTVVRCGSNCRS
jgi:hypothetical protein